MANKLISELAAMTDVDVNVIIEVQHPVQSLTKKLTLSELSTLFDTSSNLASRVTTLETNRTLDLARIVALETALGGHSILYSGVYPTSNYFDVGGCDLKVDLTFADIGTVNYQVLGSLESYKVDESTYEADTQVFWAVRDKTAKGFKLCVCEHSGEQQYLKFRYVILSI